mgnify:CR=1 FL=1
MKDWTGNSNSIWKTLGASNHTDKERQSEDYYATDSSAIDKLLSTGIKLSNRLLEPACGEGHLSKVLENRGYQVFSSDLVDRGFGKVQDFLNYENQNQLSVDILTNPPYNKAQEFVEKALDVIQDGYYVVMFLKIQFLEGKERRKLFDKYPPKYIYVNSARQICYLNGDMSKKMSSATCYCWYIWEKGYNGDTIIKWFN